MIRVRDRVHLADAATALNLVDGDAGHAPVSGGVVPVAFAGGEGRHVYRAEGVERAACGLCLW